MIPTRTSVGSLYWSASFQSRNRETYDSNHNHRRIEWRPFQFQSRNRETYDSNYRFGLGWTILLSKIKRFQGYNIWFQSRNRETYDSN